MFSSFLIDHLRVKTKRNTEVRIVTPLCSDPSIALALLRNINPAVEWRYQLMQCLTIMICSERRFNCYR
jgi:hypothetical protein